MALSVKALIITENLLCVEYVNILSIPTFHMGKLKLRGVEN